MFLWLNAILNWRTVWLNVSPNSFSFLERRKNVCFQVGPITRTEARLPLRPQLSLSRSAGPAGAALYVVVCLCGKSGRMLTSHRYSEEPESPAAPMQSGPCRYVRHPRYAAAIAGKAAMALIFGGIFGWLQVVAWGLTAFEDDRNRRKTPAQNVRNKLRGLRASYGETNSGTVLEPRVNGWLMRKHIIYARDCDRVVGQTALAKLTVSP